MYTKLTTILICSLHHNYIHLVALCRAYQIKVSTTLCWPSTTLLKYNRKLFSLGTRLTLICIFTTCTNVLWHSLRTLTSDQEGYIWVLPFNILSKRNILYSKPVFVQKYIVQHAAPKQNIFYVPKSNWSTKIYFTACSTKAKYIVQHAAPKQNIFYVPKSNWSTKIYFTACSTKAKYILHNKIKLVYQNIFYSMQHQSKIYFT